MKEKKILERIVECQNREIHILTKLVDSQDKMINNLETMVEIHKVQASRVSIPPGADMEFETLRLINISRERRGLPLIQLPDEY